MREVDDAAIDDLRSVDVFVTALVAAHPGATVEQVARRPRYPRWRVRRSLKRLIRLGIVNATGMAMAPPTTAGGSRP